MLKCERRKRTKHLQISINLKGSLFRVLNVLTPCKISFEIISLLNSRTKDSTELGTSLCLELDNLSIEEKPQVTSQH